ncbi:MAG: plastocyanin/azurin family copper-binding protein [Candidatus Diapherotrites archaeon]
MDEKRRNKMYKGMVYAMLALGLVFLVSGCIDSSQPPANGNDGNGTPAGAVLTVEINSSGFSPNPLTIKQGDTVNFVNNDSALHWPASAQHPTHNVYPEPGGCIGSKFDACKGLAQGESFSFTFNEVGEWAYHDHLNAQAPFFGKIIVE